MLKPWLIQLTVDKNAPKAIYLQIVDEIISYIKSGVLKSGEMLPGTRQLATILNINRNTVVQAFDILLSEGWLTAVERHGTSVSAKLPISKIEKKCSEPFHKKEEIFRNDLIFFDDGLPDTSCAPVNELSRSYRRIFSQKAKWQIMNLSNELGDFRFREAISKMLNYNRRMNTSAYQLCITRGSQMALFLTAHCLLKKGDIVLVENPGFKPAWEVFEHAGAIIKPVSVDAEGINIEEIECIVKQNIVKAIYVTPHHQYPTTVTLSLSRRLKLIELSNEYDFTIIEDDYDNEFHFGQRSVMPISAHNEISNYVYIGTFSKLLAPAIRVGYIYSSINIIEQVGKLRKIIDMQGDNIMEQAILELINSGDIRKHHKRMVSYYLEKRNYFEYLINKYLTDRVTYKKPEGGLAFWLTPINDVNLYKVKELANKKLVSFYTPDRFSFANSISGLRIGYASLAKENLEKGIRVLGKYL